MKYNIGQQIGNLTIINWDSQKGCYTLVCTCGTYVSGPSHYISKKENSEHPSCKLCYNKYKRDNTPLEDKLINVYKSYTKSAKDRGHNFNLPLKDAIRLFKSNCTYCNSLPSNIKVRGKQVIPYQGIDRINNSLGYTEDNVVPCCAMCNYMKGTLSHTEFLNQIKLISNVQRLSQTWEYTQVSGNGKQPTKLEVEDIVYSV